MNDQQHSFVRRTYHTTGMLVGLVSVGLAAAQQWNFLTGFLAGAALGTVTLYGVVLLSRAMTQRGLKHSRGGWQVGVVQVGKYVAVIGGFYLLLTFTEASAVGIAVGYGIHLAVLAVVGATMAKSRGQ